MANTVRLFVFIVFFLAHLIGILIGNEQLQFLSKPLILLSLIFYFVGATRTTWHPYKKWVVSALLFSLLGDILLMFQERNSIFFLLGLSAFLIAHIFYIIFFYNLKVDGIILIRWWLVVPVVVYYAVLMFILSDYLHDMKVPVRIYGIIISCMLLLALHLPFLKDKKAAWLMLIGALLFVVSDSVLAINKFYSSFEYAGFVVMLTYGLAQLLITKGAVDYISSESNR